MTDREHQLALPCIWYNRDGAGPFTWHDPRLEKPRTAEEIEEFRHVARTEVSPQCWVSTIFLGVDLNILFGSSPRLFETVVFEEVPGHVGVIDLDRYPNEEAALRGHERLVEKYRARD